MDKALYKVVYDSQLKAFRMELSPHFMSLPARQGIAILKAHIRELSEALKRYRQAWAGVSAEGPANLEKRRRLTLELELCQHSIPYLQEHFHFSRRPLTIVNRFQSAA